MHNDRSQIDEAKRRVTLSQAAEKLGLPPIKPNGMQRSPFREDRHPSFSVTDDRLWNDFATGEGGDVITFIVAASGCTIAAAIAGLLAMAGIERGAPLPPVKPRPPAPPPPPKRDLLSPLKHKLRTPTIAEYGHIMLGRRWQFWAGLEIAHRRGILFLADEVQHRGETHKAWILTDAARKTGMARRLDGQGWPGPDGNSFKSLSLRADSDAPIGLADVVENDRKIVLISEGDPDFLAGLTFAWLADIHDKVGVVRLDGNSRSLTPVVAKALRGRRVRILRQFDIPRGNGKQPASEFAAAWAKVLDEEFITADAFMAEALRPATSTGDFDFADALALPFEWPHEHEETARRIMGGLSQ